MDEKKNPDDEDIAVEDMDIDLQAAYHLRIALEFLEKQHLTGGLAGMKAIHWQTAMYDLQKVIGYFDYWVVRGDDG